MTKKSRPGPVYGKVVAAAIFGALAVGYFLGLLSFIGEWLGALYHLLSASTLVPNWLLGIFAICVIIVAGMLGTSLRPNRRADRPPQDRVQHDIFNIKWRWSFDSSGRVHDLTPYCLHCDHRVVLKQVVRGPAIDCHEIRCDSCGAPACEFECSVEEFESRVLQKIDELPSR